MIAGQAPRFAPGQEPKLTGYTAARCTITVEGGTRDCTLLYAPPGVGEPFMEALKTVRYAPPTRCGRSEERTTVVRFHYEAPKRPAPPPTAVEAHAERPDDAQEEGITRTEKLSGEPPRFTEEMRYHGVRGTVVARCLVTPTGEVRDCYIVKPLPYADEAVISALRTWRMRPMMYRGKPLSGFYTFNIIVRPD